MAQGFLLHSRPYRESSCIASFITDTEGRVDVLMRRGRSSTKTAQHVSPMPFSCYELEWVGRGSLPHLKCCESIGQGIMLVGDRLYCGFYINELLYYLLPLRDPDADLLRGYHHALQVLACAADVEPVLRQFELMLLETLGYGLVLDCDAGGAPLQPEQQYLYVPEHGLVVCENAQSLHGIAGGAQDFMAIAKRDFSGQSTRRLAKLLLRSALARCLGGRSIRSRAFFTGVASGEDMA